MSSTGHMTLQQFGRSYHLRICSAEDMEHVLHLDEAHWVATSAPILSLNLDPVIVALLDPDNSGRITCSEVKEAIAWLLKHLNDWRGVTSSSDVLSLDTISTADNEGRNIHLTATKVLKQLDLPDSTEITLSQMRKLKARIEKEPVSEAGVALPEATSSENMKQFVNDIVTTLGGVPHPSGARGVNEEQLTAFLDQARAYIEWHDRGALPENCNESDIMPLGRQTPRVFGVYAALRAKIDQYFAQCEAVLFEPRAAQHLLPNDDELQTIDLTDPRAIEELIKKAPLAAPNTDWLLRFAEQMNPHYATRLNSLRAELLEPALGGHLDSMSVEQWKAVKKLLAAHESWVDTKPGADVEQLGPERLRPYLDPEYRKTISALIAESTRTAVVLDNIRLVEKIILYQVHMQKLANNFVSFPYLYDPASRAVFEMGTLIMDGRRFSFSVKVQDRAAHSALAKTSNIFVLYAEVLSGTSEPAYEVAVPVTAGGKGNLCVGKRGIFEDVCGRQHDARVIQIIENPISLREALVSPYQRLGKLLSGKIESITAASEKRFDETAGRAMSVAPTAPAKAAAGQPTGGLLAGGLLMGGGVAVAAMGSAMAYITKTLEGVNPLKVVAAVLLTFLAVMLPTSILAVIKLRSRDLSAILEGAGWAINARMRLTFRLGRVFTQPPPFPKGTRGLRTTWLYAALAAIITAEIVIILCQSL